MAFFVDSQLHDTSHRAARVVRYGRTIGLPTEIPLIPPPEIFDPDANPAIPVEASAFPTVPECAIHLKLLHSIHGLREAVQSATAISFDAQATDGKFQIQEVRTHRWNIYLRLAVLRFLKWMHVGNFPPPDILMVWQACLLNPRYFSKLCSIRKCEQLRSLAFPWKDIVRHDQRASVIQYSDSGRPPIQFDTELYLNWLDLLGGRPVLTALKHFAIQAYETEQQRKEERSSFEAESGLAFDLLGLLNSTDRDYIFHQISTWLPSVNKSVLEPPEPQFPLGNAIAAFLRTNLVADGYNKTVVDIAAAVDRQYKFVEKMEQTSWIRSPAVHGTLRRAISRYEKFVKLLKKYPDVMLVPTIDIDLVWHTHQCAGAAYQTDMEGLTGAFIDHNDKVEPTALKGGEGKTAELFRLNYGSEYSRCFCWDCETILSELETAEASGQKMNREKRKEVARKVATLVSSHRAAEIVFRHEERKNLN